VKGQRLSSAASDLDVVVVAARYAPDQSLATAQAYERRGPVWTDLVLLDRRTLIERLRSGKKVGVGQPLAVPGDFAVRTRLVLGRENGHEVLRAAGTGSNGDDLGVPLF
jgi:hypothetical protein